MCNRYRLTAKQVEVAATFGILALGSAFVLYAQALQHRIRALIAFRNGCTRNRKGSPIGTLPVERFHPSLLNQHLRFH